MSPAGMSLTKLSLGGNNLIIPFITVYYLRNSISLPWAFWLKKQKSKNVINNMALFFTFRTYSTFRWLACGEIHSPLVGDKVDYGVG